MQSTLWSEWLLYLPALPDSLQNADHVVDELPLLVI